VVVETREMAGRFECLVLLYFACVVLFIAYKYLLCCLKIHYSFVYK